MATKNKLSKDEFISMLAESANLKKKECELVLSKLSEIILEALSDKKEIPLGFLGTFKYKMSKERMCTVIKTKDSMKVPAKGGASFKISKKLKDALVNIL